MQLGAWKKSADFAVMITIYISINAIYEVQ